MKECNAEIFLNKYRELEFLIREKHHLNNGESAIGILLRSPEYRSVRNDLDYCRNVRNLLSHNPKINSHYAVEPSNEMISLLEQIIERIQNPKRAIHVCIPRNKVLCRSLDDFVLPTMVDMNRNTYTHIPIVEEDLVVGVFSENSLLRYLIDAEIVCIDHSIKFQDIKKYLSLENRRSESFQFVPQTEEVEKIECRFSDALKKSDRIGLLFVTHNGKPTEKLMGIISAWDIAGLD